MIAAVEFFRANSCMGTMLGVFLVVLEIFINIVLHAHYTMDIFADVITALLASIITNWTVNPTELNGKVKAVKENKSKQF